MKHAIVIALLTMIVTTPSYAQRRHHGAHGGHHHHHHHHHRRNYAPYALGALGLAILGGVIYDQYGRRCYKQIIGYDSWGDPVTRRICE